MILVRNGNESPYSTRRKTFLDFMGIIAQALWESFSEFFKKENVL